MSLCKSSGIAIVLHFVNQKNTAPLTLDQVFVGQFRSLFQLPQNSNPATTHLVFRPALHAHGRTDGHTCICFFSSGWN